MVKLKTAKRRPDYSTTIGILVAFALVLVSIALGSDGMGFINIQAILIVFCGTFAVTIACFSWHDVAGLRGSLRNTVFTKIKDVKEAGVDVIALAEYAKKKGLLGLKEKEDEIEKDSILAKGTQMLVDGMSSEDAEVMLKQDIESTLERNQRAAAVLRKAAEIAPAMGLIGTLIGLVQMLGQLEDPSGIGRPMAVALLTTLYGALFAYILLTPLASKIERNSDEELLVNRIYLTAIICMGNQEHPRKLQTLVNTILPPAKKLTIYK